MLVTHLSLRDTCRYVASIKIDNEETEGVDAVFMLASACAANVFSHLRCATHASHARQASIDWPIVSQLWFLIRCEGTGESHPRYRMGLR